MYRLSKLESYLCQGDIIIDFNKDKIQTFKPENFFLGILVLSFTCDIKYNKLKYVNYCPIFNFENIIDDFLKKFQQNQKLMNNMKNSDNPFQYIEDNLFNLLSLLFNYKIRNIFYLKPNGFFDEKEAYADIEQIYSISMDNKDELIKCRVASLQNPWVENLGYMLGYCFNRIALEELTKSQRSNIYNTNFKSIVDTFVDDNI